MPDVGHGTPGHGTPCPYGEWADHMYGHGVPCPVAAENFLHETDKPHPRHSGSAGVPAGGFKKLF
ncbi:hypothetical protein AGMMS49545_11580 [Betaproteobacteria bacterium]|nr:hypothetical protein AGMMS49545_11580 [Betaproteobacteria bacterium]GHU45901.1 hypothetical protein AGMMS50289_18050 [Betaproteobacteria bacterium]